MRGHFLHPVVVYSVLVVRVVREKKTNATCSTNETYINSADSASTTMPAPKNANETYCTFTLASDVTAGGLPSEADIAKDLESNDDKVKVGE